MPQSTVNGGYGSQLMPTDEGHASVTDLPDDGSQQKEVYARFGLAAYQAQVLEHGLVNLLIVARQATGQVTPSSINTDFDRLFRLSMGALLEQTEKEQLTVADTELWSRALAERNRLAHHYFREHAENFMSPEGRELMLKDADAARLLFVRADEAATRVLFSISQRWGMTPDVARAVAEIMEAEARKGPKR
jgi:hypothetical protein